MDNFDRVSLRVIQLNLHKSKFATQQLIVYMESFNIDVALIQEPHSFNGNLPGFPGFYKLYYDRDAETAKSAIILRSRNFSGFFDYKNSDYKMVSVDISINGEMYYLLSYYFEPSRNIDSDLYKLSQVFSTKNPARLIWGMDANSKSVTWCSPFNDSRGIKLSEFFSTWQLFVLNDDFGPTFSSTQGSSYIDVTAVGYNILNDVKNWCIPDHVSFSDHRLISFEIAVSQLSASIDSTVRIFNFKRANWKRFQDYCANKVRSLNLDALIQDCSDASTLDNLVSKLEIILTEGARISIPFKKFDNRNVPWWSDEISRMRKQVNAARRRYQRTTNLTIRNIYKEKYEQIKIKYKNTLKEAKLNSWKEFLSDITKQNVWKKLYRGIKSNFSRRIEISGLELPNGNFTTCYEESIAAIMENSFPGDSVFNDLMYHKTLREEVNGDYTVNNDVPFTVHEVNDVVKKLKPNKTPGPDNISNEILKKFHECSPSTLFYLFNTCFKISVFPTRWKFARIVTIPKGYKYSRPHLNNIRCISLLSCLGKGLEHLLVQRLTWHLASKKVLSTDQYGFTPHKSTENALSRLCEIVSNGKKKNLSTILVSDIKGYNNKSI